MLADFFNNPFAFLLSVAALILAITFHEYAHAYVADRLGDPTPSLQGRLTLNPLAHLDPLGTIMLLLVRFGWGKPVQFDPFNLRHPRRDAALISLAGPGMNLSLAILSSVILRILLTIPFAAASPLMMILSLAMQFLVVFITINIILCVFNLIPIHPLDGFKIVGGILSEDKAREWYQLQSYGIVFLMILMFFPFSGPSFINNLMSPPVSFLLNILLPRAPLI